MKKSVAPVLDHDPVVTVILLAKRGISASYIAKCLTRIRGEEMSAADVKRMAARCVRQGGGR